MPIHAAFMSGNDRIQAGSANLLLVNKDSDAGVRRSASRSAFELGWLMPGAGRVHVRPPREVLAGQAHEPFSLTDDTMGHAQRVPTLGNSLGCVGDQLRWSRYGPGELRERG